MKEPSEGGNVPRLVGVARCLRVPTVSEHSDQVPFTVTC